MTRQAVYQWKQIPAEKAAAISEALGLPLHELRPDLWPPPGEVS
jgi:DNA-binding transcriptional regulator YdaS (Cro superfamily)